MTENQKNLVYKIKRDFSEVEQSHPGDDYLSYYKQYRSKLDLDADVSSQVFSAEPYFIVETIVPWLCLEYIKSKKKWFSLEGDDPKTHYDDLEAKTIEEYLWKQMRKMKFQRLIPKIARCGSVNGLCPIKYSWEVRKRKKPTVVPMTILGFQAGTKIEKTLVTEYDGPKFEIVPPQDLYRPKGYSDPRNYPFIIHKFYMSIENLNNLEKSVDWLINLNELREWKQKKGVSEDSLTKDFRDAIDEKNYELSEHPRVKIYEYQTDDKIYWLAEDTILIRDSDNIFGEKTYIYYLPIEDIFEFNGIGEIEPYESTFDEINTLKNMGLDEEKLWIQRPWLIREGTTINWGETGLDSRRKGSRGPLRGKLRRNALGFPFPFQC